MNMPGIQSLMPQGPVPGQAPQQPMQGMMPKPGASTPPAQVKFLETKPSQELKAMYDQQPSLALLTAYTKAVEREKLNASMRGQQAVQQAAGAPATIADSIMQQPVMAAYGGEMHSYAGGGAVSFRHGGDVQKFSLGADEFGVLANPEAEAMDALRVERAQKERQAKVLEDTYYSLMMQGDPRAAQVKQQLDAIYGRAPVTPSAVASGPTRQGKSGIADLDIGPSMAPLSRTGAPTLIPGGEQRRQAVAAQTVGTPVQTTAKPADLTPELAAALKAQEDRLSGRLTRPESLIKAEEGLAALAKSGIEAQQAEAKTYGEEIRAARDAALARSQRDILSDPMSLLALAGSIDTRKGQGVGSLARGAAGLMGEREKQAEAAQKEFALAQRDERSMQENIRRTQMLEGQRQVALEKGKLDEVNAINDQLSKLSIDREQFRLTRGDVAFQQAMKGREVAAEETKARAAVTSAGKPTELEQRIRLFQQNPEQYRTMFGIDPKETSVELRALKDEEQQLLKRLEITMLPEAKKPIEAKLDDISRMRRTLMGGATAPATGASNDPLGLRK